MIRKVQVYIEGQRIELFDDETIEVSSSIQNIQDLSKVFTDVSLSFSVPCSQVNNPIFEYYYENALNGTINQNLRRDGFIEMDYTFFRGGKIQLEEVVLKNNQPYAYKITFYGEIRSLKDRFGEDKLSQLDYNAYNPQNNGGVAGPQSLRGNVLGLDLYVDPNAVATTIDESAFIVTPSSVAIYESPILRMSTNVVTSGEIETMLYGYLAVGVLVAGGVRRFNLT